VLLRLLGLGAAAGVLVAAAAAAPAGSALAAGGWAIVTAPPTGQNGVLYSVASSSDTDAWAVGHSNARSNGLLAQPVIDHWNGTAWSQVTAPATGYSTNWPTAVSASSSSDAWLVGWSEPQRSSFVPLAMHWNGTAWSDVSFDGTIGAIVSGVTDISPADAYAITSTPTSGTIGYGADQLTHWNGTSWTEINIPVPAKVITSTLYAISADGPDDVWIPASALVTVSSSSAATEYYALHWNGSSWSMVAMPPQPAGIFNQFSSVTALSPSNVWAVGEAENETTGSIVTTALIEHWNGTAWSVVSSPVTSTGTDLTGVTYSSASDVWAVGTDASGTTLTLNWNGSAWSVVSSPSAGVDTGLASVATTPGGSTVQAVGTTYTNSSFTTTNPFAMRYP
jgi:hypothetical protein